MEKFISQRGGNPREQEPPRGREPNVEIERKYLLDSAEDLGRLEERILSLFPDARATEQYTETSHYFSPINKEQALIFAKDLTFNWMYGVEDFIDQLKGIPDDMPIQLRSRTRSDKNTGFSSEFTFKASEDPLHGEERIEINAVGESIVNARNSGALTKLDIDLMSSWRSRRRAYNIDLDTKIDVQDVTGYGYTAEIESSSLEKVEEIEKQLGLKPADSKLLNAMYKKYSANWQAYYEGEGKHFSEEDWQEIESETGKRVVRNKL